MFWIRKSFQFRTLFKYFSSRLVYFYYLTTSTAILQRHFFLYIFILASTLVTCTNFLLSILLLSGDVEMNPGRKLVSKESFSICHWNFNSITANNYTEVLLLKAYIAVHKFDIIQACQLCKVTNVEIWQKTFKNLEIK